MNTEAIERIRGYCCEVTQQQWDELVRVADEVGLPVAHSSRSGMVKPDKFARLAFGNAILGLYPDRHAEHKLIPFPDFLAKLKGEEQWEPKAGEMVEVKRRNSDWEYGRFVAIDSESGRDWYVCYLTELKEYHSFEMGLIRKAIPTITRTEAEQLLNKRIIE
jgi:hypothetical protein